jgi:hypothetical protein
VVRGFDRLTRTGIAILFVGIFVVVGLGLVFTQSPEISNPFVETFNFNTGEQVIPMLRFGDDPRRTSSTEAGSPPTGTFITCLNQIDGEFCTDILEDVNKICTLKLIAVYRFDDGSSRTLTSSDMDNFPILIPDFSITDPETQKTVDRFSIIPRLSCEAPVFKDGERIDFAVTAENGRLAISVDAYDEFGNEITVLTTRAITIPRTIFTDEGFFRIETERSLGSVDVTANEIENDLNPSRDFNTRVIVELDGKLFIEIEDLNSLTNNFVVTTELGSKDGLPNPTNLQLDLFVDTEETTATVFKTTVSTIQPDTLVVDGDAGSNFKVNVFFVMTAYTDSEGVPECDVKERGIFGATLGTTVKAVKVTSGEDAQFSCSIPVKGNQKTGIYEVKITSPSNTSAGSSRPQTTSTFTITLEAEDNPIGNGGVPETCPTIDVLRQQIKDLTDESLLKQKANLLDKQKRGTLDLCEAITLPLVIAEVDSRGLTNTPTPDPDPDNGNGGLTCDPNTQVLTKISATQFTCVTKDPSSGGFGLPKFIACAQGVSADTSKGEICLPPSIFEIYNFVINNLLLVGIVFVVFLIIIKIIMTAIGRAGKGVVLKP